MLNEEYATLKKRGLQVMSEESGYYFVKNENGATYPIRDTTVSEWVKEDKLEEETK